MNNLRRTMLVATCAAVLAGCASGPKFAEMKAKIPSLKQTEGRIYFFRENSMMGAAIQPAIRVNGEEVGKSQPNSFFYVDRPAGRYTIAASTEIERTLSLELGAGETKYVQSSIGFGLLAGRVNFELVNTTAGQAEVEKVSYTGK
jgi:hypothetical protein